MLPEGEATQNQLTKGSLAMPIRKRNVKLGYILRNLDDGIIGIVEQIDEFIWDPTRVEEFLNNLISSQYTMNIDTCLLFEIPNPVTGTLQGSRVTMNNLYELTVLRILTTGIYAAVVGNSRVGHWNLYFNVLTGKFFHRNLDRDIFVGDGFSVHGFYTYRPFNEYLGEFMLKYEGKQLEVVKENIAKLDGMLNTVVRVATHYTK